MAEKLQRKKCKICGKFFHPNRSWQVYCSSECTRKGKSINAMAWRKMQPFHMEALTLVKIKNKDPYKGRYKHIMEAFEGNKKRGILWSELYERSGMGDKAMFSHFLRALCRVGVLKKEKRRYFISDRYKFEPLRLRERDIVGDIGTKNAIFRSSIGNNYAYYTPHRQTDYLRYSVKGLDERVGEMEDYLGKAERIWAKILVEARDRYLMEVWDKKILCNSRIFALTKLDLCLYLIFRVRNSLLWLASPRERSLEEQWSLLMDIKRKAFYQLLQKKYPALTSSQVENLYTKMRESSAVKRYLLYSVSKEVLSAYSFDVLEHLIVVAFGLDLHRMEKLVLGDVIDSVAVEWDKPVGMQQDKLKLSGEDVISSEDLSKGYKSPVVVEERLFVKPPFFKGFFHGFEEDLLELGFEPGVGNNGLEEFYRLLDMTAAVLRIPALPDDLLEQVNKK